MVSSVSGAPTWADLNRQKRGVILRRHTPVRIVAQAEGSWGWMSQVKTETGDYAWLKPTDLEQA